VETEEGDMESYLDRIPKLLGKAIAEQMQRDWERLGGVGHFPMPRIVLSGGGCTTVYPEIKGELNAGRDL
jgi:hypothetical protein